MSAEEASKKFFFEHVLPKLEGKFRASLTDKERESLWPKNLNDVSLAEKSALSTIYATAITASYLNGLSDELKISILRAALYSIKSVVNVELMLESDMLKMEKYFNASERL